MMSLCCLFMHTNEKGTLFIDLNKIDLSTYANNDQLNQLDSNNNDQLNLLGSNRRLLFMNSRGRTFLGNDNPNINLNDIKLSDNFGEKHLEV